MGALIPLALTIAPEIGKWLFGATGEKTATAVAGVVRTVTGTADAGAAQSVLSRNPELAVKLRIELAKIAAQADADAQAEQLATLKQQLADVADARAQTLGLAKLGSGMAWAPAVISVVVLATFGVVMWAALTRVLPAGSETILNMLLGTLAAMATSVVSYWVGSSSGSDKKTEMLYRSTPVDRKTSAP